MPATAYTRHTTGTQSPKMRRADAQRKKKARLRRKRVEHGLPAALPAPKAQKPLVRGGDDG